MSAAMKVEVFILITLHYLPVSCKLTCYLSDWIVYISDGYFHCSNPKLYIQGFERWAYISEAKEGLEQIKGARCCSPENRWSKFDPITDYVNWIYPLDEVNQWVHCPEGYFLGGYYRRGSSPGKISDIEAGRCTKPADHPFHYGECYEQSIRLCFDGYKGKIFCGCKEDYLVVGLYKGNCDKLRCIETLKCCTMADKPDELTELFDAKLRIMSKTRTMAARLAHYLGYGYSLGCMALYVGESFVQDGDVLHADLSGYCEGFMSDVRLSMKYSDWRFSLKSLKYSEPVTVELAPEALHSGVLINNHSTATSKIIEESQTSIRSVKHITTSSWRHSHELGLTLTYSPILSLSIEGSYKFTYEGTESRTDEHNRQQINTMTVKTRKVVEPYSGAKWNLTMSKTSTSVSYTATIQIGFSLQLSGFLIWRGASKNVGCVNTNYHYLHHGTSSITFFNYTFGNNDVPFYTELKREFQTKSKPWLWNEMIKNHPFAASDPIGILTNEELYEFNLTGKFIDVVGKKIRVRWYDIPSENITLCKKINLKTRRPKKSHTTTKGTNNRNLIN